MEKMFRYIEPYHVEHENPNIIPTEYFTVNYYWQEPEIASGGEILKDEDGELKLFESSVASLSFANKKLSRIISDKT